MSKFFQYKSTFPISILILSAFLIAPVSTVMAADMNIIDGTRILSNQIDLPQSRTDRSTIDHIPVSEPTPSTRSVLTAGTSEKFWIRNFENNKFVEITAKLAVSGRYCHVFVQEGQDVTEDQALNVQKQFDRVIYPETTGHFGHEARPGIDGDMRVFLLIADIPDGYSDENDGYVAGYFFAGDQMKQNEFESYSGTKSNEKDILYIDSYPSNPSDKDYLEIVAHEFQHMIHYNYDQEENTWVNEGCSMISPIFNGYGIPGHYTLLKKKGNLSLNYWSDWGPLPDYGKVYIWNQYIVDRLLNNSSNRKDFYRTLVTSRSRSIEGYREAFSRFGVSFTEMFIDFTLTNRLNNNRIDDGRYSYKRPELKNFLIAPDKTLNTYPSNIKGSVKIWSSTHYQADISNEYEPLNVSFSGYRRSMNGHRPYFRVAAILSGNNGYENSVNWIDLHVNPNDSNRLIGSSSLNTAGYDQMHIIIMALAPEDLDDSKYMPAPSFIYDLDIER